MYNCEKINTLLGYLEKESKEEYLGLLKISNTEEEELPEEAKTWLAVWEGANYTPPPEELGPVMEKLVSSVSKLAKYAKPLAEVDPEMLQQGAKLAERKFAMIKTDEITKLGAADIHILSTNHSALEAQLIKEGKFGLLKVLPVVGPIFSFYFAFKHTKEAIKQFEKLMDNIGDSEIRWYDAFLPEKLSQYFEENKEDPQKTLTNAKVTNSSKYFIGEFISATANIIDFIKDTVFAVIDIISSGSSILLDMGLSAVIYFFEWVIKSKWVLPGYDALLKEIKIHASDKFLSIMNTEEEQPTQSLA